MSLRDIWGSLAYMIGFGVANEYNEFKVSAGLGV